MSPSSVSSEIRDYSSTRSRGRALLHHRRLRYSAMASQIARRLRNTNRKLGDLAFMDVYDQVARTLLDLCEEPDAMTHPDGMQVRVTRQELARLVGCSREMVGKVMKDMDEQKHIAVNGKNIVVLGHTAPKKEKGEG